MSAELIKLKYPLENGLNTITLRRPKVRDMLAADKAKGGDAEREVALFANLAELTPEDIANLDMADYKQLQDVYKDFLS
jgi:hypothetical protein